MKTLDNCLLNRLHVTHIKVEDEALTAQFAIFNSDDTTVGCQGYNSGPWNDNVRSKLNDLREALEEQLSANFDKEREKNDADRKSDTDADHSESGRGVRGIRGSLFPELGDEGTTSKQL